MINVFKSFRAVRIAEKANESNDKIVETSCNLIFEKIEKAAKQGCFSLSVRDSEKEMLVTEQQRQKIIQILKEAGYKAKYIPPHDSFDNHGVAWGKEEGCLFIIGMRDLEALHRYWNECLRNKTAREVIMSAISDCEDKGWHLFRVVFIIASILYLIGGVAVYMMLYKNSNVVAILFDLFFVFMGSLLAGFMTGVIIGGAQMDIMSHKLRADTLYERYEACYEKERKRMIDSLNPRERQMALEENMIIEKMAIDEFREVFYVLAKNYD